MATDETTPVMTTSQVTTTFTGPPTVADATEGNRLYPPEGPDPAAANMAQDGHADPVAGAGIEGEEIVWEARYAMKNFIGRVAVRALLTVAWIALAIYTWRYSDGGLTPVTVIAGGVLGLLWVALVYRMVLARYGHSYRLTNRRLFISTGLLRNRRDMLELLRVKDVFTRQTLFERWLSLGSVVVVASDKETPTFYITGVDDPKGVMDLVWHHARSERDHRSVKVESV